MTASDRNIALYPWFKFAQNLMFWQAIWFLYFQKNLSASDAVLLYAIYEFSTTIIEVPSGYMSDRLGRRKTLIAAAIAGLVAGLILVFGDGFWMFALAQIPLGAYFAFSSGTDSALLFESLSEAGRADEIEAHELRAWRFNFAGLGLSAVLGGAIALWGMHWAYVATTLAFGLTLLLTLRFCEPTHKESEEQQGEMERLKILISELKHPVLVWLFALSVIMYVYSHIPFVFGQPFILASLDSLGWAENAPLISGAVTALMMLVSVLTSWIAPWIKARLGLAAILLLAFAMQIGIAAGLALSGNVFVIAVLFIRMVPNSLSTPFILARIQPLLADETRATFLSLKSLGGRLLFALSLFAASASASDVGQMAHSEIRAILVGYVIVGLGVFLGLYLTSRARGI